MDKAMIEKQAVKFTRSRSALLTVVAFTTINLFLELFEAGIYFLYSAFFPQIVYLVLGYGYNLFGLGVVLALAITSIYLVCWALSGRRRVFILVAMILFALDTLGRIVFVVLFVVLESDIDIWMAVEFVFCVWILISLIGGTIAWAKLRRVTPDELSAIQQGVVQAEETEAVRSVFGTGTSDQDDDLPPTV